MVSHLNEIHAEAQYTKRQGKKVDKTKYLLNLICQAIQSLESYEVMLAKKNNIYIYNKVLKYPPFDHSTGVCASVCGWNVTEMNNQNKNDNNKH